MNSPKPYLPRITLGELIDSGAIEVTSGFPCGDHNSDGAGVLQIRPFNVTANASISLTTQKHVPGPVATGRPMLEPGDIIFNNTNTKELVGKTAAWNGPPGSVFSNHMTRIRPTDQAISSIYLASAIHAHWIAGRSEMLARSHVAQASILGERFREIEIPWPKETAQLVFADAFKAVQDGIQVEADLIENLVAIKAAAMRALFTRGLRGDPQKDCEIGSVPESWLLVRIDALGRVVTGNTPPTKDRSNYDRGDIPFIAPGDIEHGRRTDGTEKFLSRQGLKSSRPLPKGSTCFVCIGSTIGKVGMTTAELSCTNQQINSVIPYDDFDAGFVFHLLTYWSDHIKKERSPSPVPIMSKGVFEKVEIWATTDKNEQQEIASILDVIDAKIDLHKRKKTVLEELFRALLHKLMTGAIRVADLELSALQSSQEVAA